MIRTIRIKGNNKTGNKRGKEQGKEPKVEIKDPKVEIMGIKTGDRKIMGIKVVVIKEETRPREVNREEKGGKSRMESGRLSGRKKTGIHGGSNSHKNKKSGTKNRRKMNKMGKTIILN